MTPNSDDDSLPSLPPETMALIGAVLNGTATDEEKERINEVLLRDADARRVYRRYVNLHSALHIRFALPESRRAKLPLNAQPVQPFDAPTVNENRPLSWAWVLTRIAAIVALVSAASVLALWPNTERTASSRVDLLHHGTSAKISKVSDARWGPAREIRLVNSSFPPGPQELTDGMAELTLSNGVSVVLEAPVQFTLQSAGKVSLQRGRMVAFVPPEARGFEIETPHSNIVDLGTEFGVGVDSGGATEVQVFRGEVITKVKGRDGDQRVPAGSAVSIDSAATPRGIPFQPQRFVRMFPTENDSGQPAGPLYNHSANSTVQVLPATGKIKIDGDLSEWNHSGMFNGACMPPYRESHYLDGMMMYDSRYLYIGAHVGDPAPMCSQMNPDDGRDQYSWQGGSVIVRLATDPALGWPMIGMGPAERNSVHPEYGSRPEDISNNIVHLTMWYHQPSGKARLQLSFGMDFHGEIFQPAHLLPDSDGWDGVFRADADGRGYTLEYAIPWSMLNAARRPLRAGDVVAANWTVHWSDEKGAVSRGHLVEIANPDFKPFRFLRGNTWGKAVFK